jgi:hypothetical protein
VFEQFLTTRRDQRPADALDAKPVDGGDVLAYPL